MSTLKDKEANSKAGQNPVGAPTLNYLNLMSKFSAYNQMFGGETKYQGLQTALLTESIKNSDASKEMKRAANVLDMSIGAVADFNDLDKWSKGKFTPLKMGASIYGQIGTDLYESSGADNRVLNVSNKVGEGAMAAGMVIDAGIAAGIISSTGTLAAVGAAVPPIAIAAAAIGATAYFASEQEKKERSKTGDMLLGSPAQINKDIKEFSAAFGKEPEAHPRYPDMLMYQMAKAKAGYLETAEGLSDSSKGKSKTIHGGLDINKLQKQQEQLKKDDYMKTIVKGYGKIQKAAGMSMKEIDEEVSARVPDHYKSIMIDQHERIKTADSKYDNSKKSGNLLEGLYENNANREATYYDNMQKRVDKIQSGTYTNTFEKHFDQQASKNNTSKLKPNVKNNAKTTPGSISSPKSAIKMSEASKTKIKTGTQSVRNVQYTNNSPITVNIKEIRETADTDDLIARIERAAAQALQGNLRNVVA